MDGSKMSWIIRRSCGKSWLPASSNRISPRQNEGRKEKNEIMERFAGRRDPGAGLHHGHRGGSQRAQRHGHDGGERRALRPGPASSASGTRGRGGLQSYCIFVCGSDGKETRKRLGILNRSNDGFYIASEDLKLRGPGDLFGVRQSGILDFRLGDIFSDALILQAASDTAAFIMEKSDKFL